jgi:hypothetical protein
MNRCQFAIALAHIRVVHTLKEVGDQIPAIQEGLYLRLGARLTPEEALEVWERLAEDLWASSWTRVDTGSLDACAGAIEAAYRWVIAQTDATAQEREPARGAAES